VVPTNQQPPESNTSSPAPEPPAPPSDGVPSPKPGGGANSSSNDTVIYQNGQFNWGGDYSYAANVNYNSAPEAPTPTGDTKVATVTLTGSDGGYQPFAVNWNQSLINPDGSRKQYLSFQMYDPSNADKGIYAMKVGDIPATDGSLDLSKYKGASQNGWTTYNVPLSDLGLGNESSMYKFAIQDHAGAGATFQLDNIRLSDKPESLNSAPGSDNPVPIPSPAPGPVEVPVPSPAPAPGPIEVPIPSPAPAPGPIEVPIPSPAPAPEPPAPPVDKVPAPQPGGSNLGLDQLKAISEQQFPIHQNNAYGPGAWDQQLAANVAAAGQAAQSGSQLEFFGDSITAGLNWDGNNMAPFQKNFGQYNPTAFGIGGDGSQGLLYRLNHGEFQGNPKVAVMMIGTNDINNLTPEQIKQNAAESIQSIEARSPGTKVLLMGILPRPSVGDPGNVQVNAANDALSQLANGSNVVFQNIGSQFLNADGTAKADLYQADGLHPSEAGYQVWESAIQPQLDAMLKGGSSTAQGGDSPAPVAKPPVVEPPVVTGQTLPLDTAHMKYVNLSGAESPGGNIWPTTADIAQIAKDGFNGIRLPISMEQFQPQLNGPLDSAQLQKLDGLIQSANQYGLKVDLDLHNFDRYYSAHGPNGEGVVQGSNSSGQLLTGDQLGNFWSRMAQHIDGNPVLSSTVSAFDLQNEPYDDNGTWAATAQSAIQAIRATGDQHTIAVEGTDWAKTFNPDLIAAIKSDPLHNTVAEAHNYWDADGSGSYGGGQQGPATNDPNLGVKSIENFVNTLKANNINGFVGEWGVPNNNPAWDPMVTNYVNYLAQNGVGNADWGYATWGMGSYNMGLDSTNGDPHALTVIKNVDRQAYGI
jgi:lysophospholipase L1-like esterase/aryl-phospho-beta-D-glucosidase BglC (GH1 family)